jgi:hypothetical protein
VCAQQKKKGSITGTSMALSKYIATYCLPSTFGATSVCLSVASGAGDNGQPVIGANDADTVADKETQHRKYLQVKMWGTLYLHKISLLLQGPSLPVL